MRHKRFVAPIILIGLLISLSACDALPIVPIIETAIAPAPVQHLTVRVISRMPHDTGSYTEGLLWHEGTLYESSGLDNQSSLRQVDPLTGTVLRQVPVPNGDFGEGISIVGNHIIQLTWKQKTAFVYDLATLKVVSTYTYEGEGWGMCTDAAGQIFMSNGSDTITVRDPNTFGVIRQFQVTLDGTPVDQLNELEVVDGALYANVWLTDRILRINPITGRVTAVIDAAGLLTAPERTAAGSNGVLNGIAYDPQTGNFLITGKLWPWLFAVQFVPQT